MDKERLEEIKDLYLFGVEKGIFSLDHGEIEWLISTVEEQQKVIDYLSGGSARLNEYLQLEIKAKELGRNVADVAIERMEEQQREINKLNTLGKLHELAEENARLREALQYISKIQQPDGGYVSRLDVAITKARQALEGTK